MGTYVDNLARCLRQEGSQCYEADLARVAEGMDSRNHQPTMLTCPSRVRKAMERNLRAAARSRIDPTRAAIARRLLSEIENGTAAVHSTRKNVAAASEQSLAVPAPPVPAVAATPAPISAKGAGGIVGVFRKARTALHGRMARPLRAMWQRGRSWLRRPAAPPRPRTRGPRTPRGVFSGRFSHAGT